MVDHKITKPALFISHATSDGDFAVAVKREIEKVFANGISVFCTSSPGTIPVGTDWLSDIEDKLGRAQAVVAIVTPVSVERPWLWFEIGATWGKGRTGDCKIYPLCAPEIDLADLPAPLDRLQALSMGRAPDLKQLFKELVDQFGFGDLSAFKASNITKRIPMYKNVKVASADLSTRRFYSGRYGGYSDEELMEVLDAKLFGTEGTLMAESLFLSEGRESSIYNGKLMQHREVDGMFDLPPGTSSRLLAKVARRHSLKPIFKGENVLRFGHDDRAG
jgi:hypothetical protein